MRGNGLGRSIDAVRDCRRHGPGALVAVTVVSAASRFLDAIFYSPWSRRHPSLSGFLCVMAYLVFLFVALPPLVWLLWPALRYAAHAMLWWWRLWQS